MRWCRRGPLLLAGLTILVLVIIHFLWGIVDTNVATSSENYRVSTDFFTRNYTLMQESNKAIRTCSSSNVDVLLIVPSAVSNQAARESVRESWKPYMPSSWLLVFFLGTTTDSDQQERLRAEANKYEDIIQDSRFLDSYYNLTLKTLGLLQWTQKSCRDAKFLLKIDDDMYLNIPKLHTLTTCIDEARKNIYSDKRISPENVDIHSNNKEMNISNISNKCSKLKPGELIHFFINANTHDYESYFFGGYLYEGVKADRNKNSKWYLGEEVYSPSVLPPFLSGTAYIMSTNLIKHLLYEAKQEPVIVLEDVYISGLVGSSRLKLSLSHLEGWSRFRPQWNSVCLFKDLITVHGLSSSELLAMTKSVHNLDPVKCDTIFVHITNFFNSKISSLFPRVN